MEYVLIHEGIKGQKWGVRNGPPYPLGYSDHSATQKRLNPKSKIDGNSNTSSKKEYWQMSLEEQEAYDRKRALKIALAVSAGVLVGVTAYAYVKSGKGNKDFIIKAGQTIQRIDPNPDKKILDMFYATPDKGDMMKYRGIYGQWKTGQGNKVFQKMMTASSDIKVAGFDKSKQVYENLKKTNPDFAKALKNVNYDDFNHYVMLQEHNSGNTKTFFDTLQKMGYGGVLDVNDVKFSGYESKKPVIFFNQENNISIKSLRELPIGEINRDANLARKKIIGKKNLEKNLDIMSAFGVVGATGVGAFSIAALGKTYIEEQLEKKANEVKK